MIAAQGILTSRGGKTSHAAVVARGMGKTCVCGAEELDVDTKGRTFTAPRRRRSSRRATSSRSTARPARSSSARCRCVPSPVVQYFEGELDADADDADELVAAVHRLMAHADGSAAAAGAGQRRHPRGRRAGPPLRRAGHRPVPHRAHVPRRAAPARRAADPGRDRRGARGGAGRAAAAAARGLRRHLRGDGRAAGHDPAARPAAARVPARPHRAVGRGRAWPRRRGEDARRASASCSQAVQPAARAEPDARPARRAARPGHARPVRDAGRGRSPRPRPSVKAAAATRRSRSWCRSSAPCRSSRSIRDEAREILAEVRERDRRQDLDVPDRHDDRAAARGADRRPDRRGRRVLLLRHQRPDPDDLGLLPRRRRGRVLLAATSRRASSASRPFESLDREGVGGLVRIAAEEGRATRPDLKLGVCGEHGGDPDSVHFFHEVGLDYVSCSPFRVPGRPARGRPGGPEPGGQRQPVTSR